MRLMAFWETMRLTREINYLQKRIMQKHTELSHLSKYAGVLGSSSVMNLSNVAGLSPTLLPRAIMFGQYSNQVSSMSAMQNLQQLQMMGMLPCAQNPIAQYQINLSAYAQLKEQTMKALKEREAAVLNEKETEIRMELTALEQQLEEAKAMRNSVKDVAKEEAKEDAPKF